MIKWSRILKSIQFSGFNIVFNINTQMMNMNFKHVYHTNTLTNMTHRISKYLYGWCRDPTEVVPGLGRGGGVETWSSERVRVWAEHGGRAQQQDSERSPPLWTPRQSLSMFDNSDYPFNCFNYDGDGYPTSSTEEDKKMCRPAYRYECSFY